MKKFISRYPDLASLILSALIAGVIFLILLLSLFQLLIHFYPAETILEDGSVVKNQAFAQFFMSLVVSGTIGFISFVVLFFRIGRKLQSKTKKDQ